MLGIILSLATQANSQEESPMSDPEAGETNEAPTPKPLSPIEKKKRRANATVVTLLASSLTETDARFAEDIRNEINTFGPEGVRVMPILGNGGQQNLEDLLLLTGIDMAIVGEAHLEELKSSNPDLYGKIHNVVRYIAKLYDAELHILARAPLTRLGELRGKRVSFNLRGSQAHIVGKHLFQMAGLDCEIAYYDNHEALEAMKEGKLDAHLIVSGAPQPFLGSVDAGEGINLIPVTEEDIAGGQARSLYERYLPGTLTHDHYPDLIEAGGAVPTIATRALLAVYKWPKGSFRYGRIEHFVKTLFDRSEALRNEARHAKWRELNLAAEVPGWTRFQAASEWLAKHNAKAASAADNPRETKIREQFEKFLARHEQLSGEKVKTDEENESLYRRFKQFIAFQDARVDE
jgi:TRAP transporter TAXI family solute receptor